MVKKKKKDLKVFSTNISVSFLRPFSKYTKNVQNVNFEKYSSKSKIYFENAQSAFTCSKLTIKTLAKGKKYVQS